MVSKEGKKANITLCVLLKYFVQIQRGSSGMWLLWPWRWSRGLFSLFHGIFYGCARIRPMEEQLKKKKQKIFYYKIHFKQLQWIVPKNNLSSWWKSLALLTNSSPCNKADSFGNRGKKPCMWGNGPVTLRGLILSKVFGSSRETPTATTITVVTILNKSGF